MTGKNLKSNNFLNDLEQYFKDTPLEMAINHNINIETRLEFLLPFLGIPTNIQGYEYIKYAIILVCNDEKKLKKVTTGLYNDIGKKFNSNASRVERSMRHAIDICFSRMDLKMAKWLFGYSVDPVKGKCTNTEFISRISRLLTKT